MSPAEGIFGMPRLTNRGPLTFNQSDGNLSINEIEEEVVRLINELDIDPKNPTEEELGEMHRRLADAMFNTGAETPIPEGTLLKRTTFINCMRGSSWARKWESGMRDVTTELASPMEAYIVKANGCQGVANSDSVYGTILAFTEQDKCVPSNLPSLR